MDYIASTDKTQAFGRIGQLLIGATSARKMTDQGCHEMVEYIARQVALGFPTRFVLQYSPTQSPSAAQRRLFTEGAPSFSNAELVIILTDSQLARGAVTAMTWLIRGKVKMRAYKPSEHQEALRVLAGLTPFSMQEATALLTTVVAAVGLPPLA